MVIWSKFTVIFLSFVLLISACGKDEKSQKREINVLCTTIEEWCAGMKVEFEKRTNISVNYVRMSAGEALARLRNSKDDPEFDLWWSGSIDNYILAKNEGLLAAYDSPNYVNLADPVKYKDPDNMWVGIYFGSLGFCTNTEWLAEHPGVQPPESWADLLKPEFKGQIVVAHPSSSGTAYTMLSTIVQLMGEEEGWAYLDTLSDQIYQFTRAGKMPGTMVGSGEGAVCIIFTHDLMAMIHDQNLPLVLSFPKDGTGYEIGGMAILKGAKNRDEAEEWFDWLLTPEAQVLGITYKAYPAPTATGADLAFPELLQVNLIDYDFVWSGENKDALVQRFTTEIATADNLRE